MNWNLHALADDARMRKLNAVLPGLATAVVVVLAAWTAAGLTWQVVEAITTEPALPAAETVDDSAGAGEDRVDIQRIADLHLFGQAAAEDQPVAVDAIDAPETRLNLQLQGILAADGEGEGLAIIRSGKKESVYGPGDSIAGGARVHSVLADRVLLRRGGQLETLRLPKLGADVEGIEISDQPAPPGPVGSSAELDQLRNQLRENPAMLSEMVRFQPVMRDGSMVGYQIFPRKDRAAFSKVGLRPGDLVTAINGTPLSDPAQAMGMMNSLQQSSSITLTIERGGETISVSLNASQ